MGVELKNGGADGGGGGTDAEGYRNGRPRGGSAAEELARALGRRLRPSCQETARPARRPLGQSSAE